MWHSPLPCHLNVANFFAVPIMLQITDISKRISHEWKALPAEERKKWELIAKTDKERFIAEKKNYKGPWQLPIKSGSQVR